MSNRHRPFVALLAVVVSLILISPDRARAETEKGVLGLGLIVGEPTGICGKFYLGDDRAIDFAAGATFLGRGLQLQADYVFHPFVLDNTEVFALPFFVGPGLRIQRRDGGDAADAHSRFGLRLVAGILFDFREVPIDVFVEAALVGDYRTIDNSRFGIDINAGAGVRYYF